MRKFFKGVWGDLFCLDTQTMNIEIRKKDGKIFYISKEDIRNYLEFIKLEEIKKETEDKISFFMTEIL